mmetsp:Transcript_22229/g.74777  ORF Transcript_22229/g.74777 Transcript_22229/m.74777 type:complete len:188 (+) Transcript_22229:43-606(+)
MHALPCVLLAGAVSLRAPWACPHRTPPRPAPVRMAAWHVAPLGPEHLPQLLALDQDAHAPGLWTEAQYASEVANPRCLALGAFDHPESPTVSGMLFMTVVQDEAMITNLGVRADRRGQGAGASLLDAALDMGRERGVQFFVLEVRDRNAVAKRLYESRGFARAGTRRGYYARPSDDAAVLVCDLASR